ncbi:GGDEF domain-containing protein [Aureimonas fodinaquatilis]|uniref:diguanylate cyclase n=1 Tax=Aureimonas fodinaquatilis TaxID=2565783 RepID=A0A5B0E1L6_9HYPH|nr:GGDEF domain-containing protein [Aureimonas fodinaquatilis]KAA0971861.1 GGDEF domain-containing protein [Aureimonas fodinaquatilis]
MTAVSPWGGRIFLRAIAVAVASAAGSVLIALIAVPAIGGSFDGNGLLMCVVCSVLISGPASAFHFRQHDRLLAAHRAVKDLNASLAAANAELAERATRDGLSGMLNRSEFYRQLAAVPKNGCGAFYAIDMDDFKLVNDWNGHLVGDEAIRRVASVFTLVFDAEALIGRTGGDEFCIFAPVASRAEAEQEGQAAIVAIAELDLVNPHTGRPVQISVSIGYAFFERIPPEVKTGVNMADQALYEAKRSGRGRLIGYTARQLEAVQASV